MSEIPNESVDMILTDLPYGTTANKWDSVINFSKLWAEYERIIKPNGAIALFASGQFTHKLIMSNEKLYRYKWVWFKNTRSNFVNAKNRPMTAYEEILIFSKGTTANGSKNKMCYYPQGLIPKRSVWRNTKGTKYGTVVGKRTCLQDEVVSEYTNYPFDVLQFESVVKPQHPTQKPVDLLEYLIKTYTNTKETVLDSCMGSGSTGVACVNTDRNFIGIEKDSGYFEIAKERINGAKMNIK